MHVNVRSVDVGRVWDCMMCTCVSEEGGDGESEVSEALSLLSCTRGYVSLVCSRTRQTMPASLPGWVVITDAPVYIHE